MASIIKRCDCGDWDGCPHPWVVRYRTEGGRASRQREESFGDDLKEAENFLLKVPPDAACGYRLAEAGSLVREPPQVFALQSAGGLWSTGPDLVRFGSGWRTLLPAGLAEQALRPQVPVPQRDPAEETGLGWGLRRVLDAAGQAGAGPGFAVSLIMRPSTGRTIVVLTNRQFTVLALNAELIRSAA